MLFVASASLANAVIADHRVSRIAFSSTALIVASPSIGAVTSKSSTSLTLIVITAVSKAAIATRGSHRDVVAGSGFAIEQRAVVDGDHPADRIDFEPSASCVVESVGDGVVAVVSVARENGHTDDGVGRSVLIDRVNRGIAVDRRGDIELINVIDVDRHHGGVETAVTRRGSHRDAVAGSGFPVEQRAVVDGDDPADRIDLEPTVGGVVESVGDGVVAGIRVARENGHTDHRVSRSVFINGVNRGVAVDRRGDIELVDVVDVDRHHGSIKATVTRRGSHGDVVAGNGFAIEQRAVVNSDDTTNRIDLEPSTSVIVERVGDRTVGRIRVARERGYADHRVGCSALVDGIDRGVAVGRRGDIELIDVVNVDRHHRGVETAVTRHGSHRDVVASSGFAIEQRAVVDGDHPADRIDLEPTASVIVQCVSDRAVGRIRVARKRGHADHRVSRSVFINGVNCGVAVDRRGNIELIDVVDVDRHHRGVETAIATRGPDRDVVAGSSFPVEQRAVVDGDHPADGIDFEPSASCVVESVGDGVVAGIRVARKRGHADHRVSRSVLIDYVNRGIAVDRRGDIELINVVNVDRHHRGVETAIAGTGPHRDVVASSGFAIEQRAVVDGDHPADRIDLEPTASVIVQCVSDRAVGRIRVARKRGHADHRVSRSVFINGVNRGVAVDRRGNIELIDVVNVDRHHRGVETAVTRRGSHGDVVAGSSFPVEQRAVVDGDHPADRIDLEPTASVIVQCVSDRAAGRIRVARKRGHADHRVSRSVFINGVNCGVAVDRRGNIELIDVVNVDRHHRGVETAVTRRGSHGDVVAGSSFPVEQRAVVNGDHPADRIDFEPSAGGVVESVGDGVVAGIRVARKRGHADHRVSRSVFINGVNRGIAVDRRGDIELINVINVNRHHGGVETAVTRRGSHRDVVAGSSFPVEQRAVVDGDHPADGIDFEPSAGCVVEIVGDGVVAGIRVARECGHADHRVSRSVLIDSVNRGIAVDRRGDIELIDVVNVDRHHRGVETAVTRRGSHGDVVAGSGFPVEQRAVVNSDHTTSRIDFEPSTSVIVQCVSNRAVAGICVARERGHRDHRVSRSVLINGVNCGVAVDRRGDIELINVIDVNRHHGGVETAVTRRGSHRDVVAGGSFAIEQCAVVDGDHPADRIDLEPTAGGVVQRVGDRAVGRIRVARECGYADDRVSRSVFINGVNRGVAVDRRGDIEVVDVVNVDRYHGSIEAAVATTWLAR